MALFLPWDLEEEDVRVKYLISLRLSVPSHKNGTNNTSSQGSYQELIRCYRESVYSGHLP